MTFGLKLVRLTFSSYNFLRTWREISQPGRRSEQRALLRGHATGRRRTGARPGGDRVLVHPARALEDVILLVVAC